jgi:hypothetical protein
LAKIEPQNKLNNPSNLKWEIISIKQIERNAVDLYEVQIELTLWRREGLYTLTTAPSDKFLGSINSIWEIPIAQIGERYYLVSLPNVKEISLKQN